MDVHACAPPHPAHLPTITTFSPAGPRGPSNRLSGKTHTIAAGGSPWRPSTGDCPSSAPLVTQQRLSRRPHVHPAPLTALCLASPLHPLSTLIYTLISPPRLLLSVEDEFAGARRSAMFALAAGLCLASLPTTRRSVTRHSDTPPTPHL